MFGAFGAVAGRRVFESANRWGIPELRPDACPGNSLRLRYILRLPLFPYRSLRRKGICHFFLMDERFEVVWNRPAASLKVVRKYVAVLTPDFSLYSDMPLAEQIWNTYRSRWMGWFWQEQGLRVIATVGWSTPKSYEFCFEGIPKRQVVAIGTPGLRNPMTRRLFERGLREMFRRLEPVGLIVFGIPPKDFPLAKLIPKTCRCVVHPNRWQEVGAKLAARRGERKKAGTA